MERQTYDMPPLCYAMLCYALAMLLALQHFEVHVGSSPLLMSWCTQITTHWSRAY